MTESFRRYFWPNRNVSARRKNPSNPSADKGAPQYTFWF